MNKSISMFDSVKNVSVKLYGQFIWPYTIDVHLNSFLASGDLVVC